MTAPAQAPRRLALCADDFGLTPGISEGIARLVHARRLTAVSCITNSPSWAAGARLLDAPPAGLRIGLHLNLTEGRPLSRSLAGAWPQLPSLPALIARAYAGQLPRAALRSEMAAQLERFCAASGAMPHHLDGHQHVHHLPVVRELLLELAAGIQPAPAVRNAAHVLGPGFGFKRWMIAHTGAGALEQALVRRRLAHNTVLLGVYDFQEPDYGRLMRRWLSRLPEQGGLVFCHPGAPDAPAARDPIAMARKRELSYLMGDAFLSDLQAADVALDGQRAAPTPARADLSRMSIAG